ncbi:MAG TPA: hypothetical protein VK843_17965 [Planctomycetota bacterium]|nr:hypothetical protein [Planctomycetota bacterium]
MEFHRFLNVLMLIPCQVVKTARRVWLRVLTYKPWVRVPIEGMEWARRRKFA